MNILRRTIIWRQFGAAIDMPENALNACPDEFWCDRIWDDPTDAPEYIQFWFIVYHAHFGTDFYRSGWSEVFAPPPPLIRGALPKKTYPRAELRAHLEHSRRKCQVTFEGLTDGKASQPRKFLWGEEVGFAELQLYSVRHVQEHASQLSLHLEQKGVPAPDWVARPESGND